MYSDYFINSWGNVGIFFVKNWVTVGILCAASAAAGIAWKNLGKVRHQIEINTFSVLLKELGSNEASVDRSIVYKQRGKSTEEIRSLVKGSRKKVEDMVEKQEFRKSLLPGDAIEGTIVRLDRVGFFIIGHSRKPTTKPPEWLWTIVAKSWQVLGEWVKYRQDPESGEDFYHQGYGIYFEKLALEARKRGRDIEPKALES